MSKRIALVLVTALALGGCGTKRERDLREIRGLIPEAASTSEEEFVRLTSMRGAARVDDFRSQGLTAVLMTSPVGSLGEDLVIVGMPDPARFADVLRRDGLVSVIHAEDITGFECEIEGDKATGEVRFEVEGFWRGRAGFSAEKRGGRWAITEFRLPAVGRRVRLGKEGTWLAEWTGVPPASESGVDLPSLEGLALTKVGPFDDGPAGVEKLLRKVTIDVPAKGTARIADVRDASRWRGMGLPRDAGQQPIHRMGDMHSEIRVKIWWANSRGQVISGPIRGHPSDKGPGPGGYLSVDGAHVRMSVNRRDCRDVGEVARVLGEVLAQHPDLSVVIDARALVPYGRVLRVLAVVAERTSNVKFQAPAVPGGGGSAWWRKGEPVDGWPLPLEVDADGICSRLKEEAKRTTADRDGLPRVCVRVRADAETPYRAVQEVMLAAMRAYVWRISLVGRVGTHEVEIGELHVGPEEDVVVPDGVKVIEMPIEVAHPVFVHEEDEIRTHMETENYMESNTARWQEDAISDIPLGGTGVVGNFGIGIGGGGAGCYGFRTGGGRKRAALRNGGSKRSEAAVDDALRWLARNQEPDGSWAIEKWEGSQEEDARVGVTGLAVLAFLGAGHTEKTGRYRHNVTEAVNYLISKQAANGAIGNNAATEHGGGYNHAIAGLALAEAYGMGHVARTGKAAQKAVTYSTDVHQSPNSGWRYGPRKGSDTSVTGWFVMQLKSATVAGLKVNPRGFTGALAWLNRVTESRNEETGTGGGRASYQPGEAPTVTMTAIAMLGRQFMSFKRTDPLLQGGAEYLLTELPAWDAGPDWMFYYWYYGTLAMFQMGDGHWKQWNGALRDMLIGHQINDPGNPERDGSWDPIRDGEVAGRAYSTAICCMCLEVYYRYLPLYK